MNVPIFFAFGIEYFTAELMMRMFVPDLTEFETSNGELVNMKPTTMTVCTVEHLKSVFDDDQAQQLFDDYNLKEKYCTNTGLTVPLFGKYNTNAEKMTTLTLQVYACYPFNVSTCFTQG